MVKRYENGSYKFQDVNGKLYKIRVNGWRLKPYFLRFKAGADRSSNSNNNNNNEDEGVPILIGNDVSYARGINTSNIQGGGL